MTKYSDQVQVSEKSLKEAIAKLDNAAQSSKNPVRYNQKEAKDQQRSKIVTRIINGYLYLIAASILVILIYNFLLLHVIENTEDLIDIKDFLLVIGSLIGSPLGFIIGYYFKEESR